VDEAAVSGRAVDHFAGPRLGERDEFFRGAHGQRRVQRQYAHLTRERCDADEILQRLVRQLLVEVRVRDVGRRLHHDRVAIGWAVQYDFGTDRAGRAAAVLDHELLPELLGHFLKYDASYDVVRTAGREDDHDAHRLRGVRLRDRMAGAQEQRQTGVQQGHRCQAARGNIRAHRNLLAL
jgi:hypothetical protein